jgi:hypothetical protein
METQPSVVAGQPCVRVASAHLVVDVARDVGPRVLGLCRPGGNNVFAELPEMTLPHQGTVAHLYGGHRLWDAPEVPARTWAPDDGPVAVEVEGLVATARGTPRPDGLGKEISVSLDPDGPTATVRHRLRNEGTSPVTVAPWALSMLRPGGTATLPLALAPTDSDGVQSSSCRIVLWPYTNLADPAISWRPDAIVVDTSAISATDSPTNKLGVATTAGWCTYVIGPDRFTKTAAVEGSPVDFGAIRQLFWERRFVELETLGSLQQLEPGAELEHIEQWELTLVEPGQL